jgi:hypothetical protein
MSRRDFALAGLCFVSWLAAGVIGVVSAAQAAAPSKSNAEPTAGAQSPAAGGGTVRKRIPFIHGTDLFHPHDDPDDHFDLATVFAMPELDVRAILLDLGKRQGEKPGRIPVEQMLKLSGRKVPYAVGLNEKLKSPEDKGLDQSPECQGAIDLLLKTGCCAHRRQRAGRLCGIQP